MKHAGSGSQLNAEWIDFLEFLGRTKHTLIFSDEFPFAEQLVHHFCSNPAGRAGLLPVIVAAAECGNRCKLPRDVLETVRGWGGPANEAATLLMLTVDDLADHEIAGLIGTLWQRKTASNVIWHALRIAATASTQREAKVALAAVEVFSSDSEDNVGSLETARSSLVDYLTGRPSTFDAFRLCPDLGLPLQNGN